MKRARSANAFAALVASFALACAVVSSPAHAEDSPTDEAAAQALFDEAKTLTQSGRWTEACPKLEESQRLAPGIGTKFNLADCYEHTGKLASAWAAFMDVAGTTRAKGQRDREQVARDRAAALEPRLSRLIVVVPKSSRIAGLVVKRDGVVLGEAVWGVAVPVDAGSHGVAAFVDGREVWQSTKLIEGEGKTERVELPPLSPSPSTSTSTSTPTSNPGEGRGLPSSSTTTTTPPPTSTIDPTPTSVQRSLAYVLGGAGIVSIAIGGYFGLRSLSKRDDAQTHCTGDACDPTGLALRDDAISAGTVSTVGFAIGAVALAGAVVLFVTSPSAAAPQLRAGVGPSRATLGFAW